MRDRVGGGPMRGRALPWTKGLVLAVAAVLLLSAWPALWADSTVDLMGTWKFKGDWGENGQQAGWQNPELDESTWRDINVPGPWEEEGVKTFNPRWRGTVENDSYNGYAWYRRHFQVPAEWGQTKATLSIGSIDDMDWTYVNGKLVGTTSGDRAFEQARQYEIPEGLLKPDADNVIAIRVLDYGGVGGIINAPVEISKQEPAPEWPEEEPGHYTETRRDMVQVIGSVVVPPNVKVEGDAVAVGGSVDVQGYVTGAAVAVGGSVRVRPGATVGRDAVAVGGRVRTEEGGVVEGQVVQISFLPWMGDGHWELNPFGGIFAWWPMVGPLAWLARFLSRVAFWGIIGLVLAGLFPKRLEAMARALPLYPGLVAAYGVVGAIMTPAVFSLLVMAGILAILVLLATVVGIALIPAVVLALACVLLGFVALLVFGLGGVWLGLGKAIVGPPADPGTARSVIGPTLLGVLLTAAVSVLPVIGALVVITMLIFAYGVALMTGVGASPEWSHNLLRLRRGPQPATPQPPSA